MVKRSVVGAHYGLRDWLIQRVTAGVMALYSLFMAGFLLTRPRTFEAWQGLFGYFPVRLATLVFLLCVFAHAWVGMRDIFMDYVHHTVLRLALHVGVLLALAAYALWAAQILWGV